MEIWKQVKGYEDNYICSSKGQVKSIKRNKVLKQNKSPMYYSVDLCKNGEIKRHLIHRIIAMSFHENPQNKPQVNHINGNKLDNRSENLEWVTRSENQLHSIRIGLRHTRGENNSQSKLNSNTVLEIFNSNKTLSELALKYNVSKSTICDIKRGYSWTHITGMPNIKKYKNVSE